MVYTKQTFTAGQTLKASDLNTMSEGVVEAIELASQGGSASAAPNVIKKAAFLGDSIIHGVYSYFNASGGRENGFSTDDAESKRIPAYFAELAGAEVLNLGKRGSGYVQDTRNLGNGLEVVEANDFSDVDFVGICLGINDWIQGASLGSFSATGSSGGVSFKNGFVNMTQLVTDIDDAEIGASVRIRLVSLPVYGQFTIEVNEGYRIRNVVQFTQKLDVPDSYRNDEITPAGEKVGDTSTDRVTYTSTVSNKYTMMTIAKADASQAISPDEDIVKSITFPSSEEQEATIPNVVEGTVVGNMVLMFQKILEDNPLCKIVCYSPYNSWGQVSVGGDYTSNVLYGSEDTNYALGATNGAGYTLQDLIDAVDKVCLFYGITHVPLSKNNLCNRINIKNVMVDGLHPSQESREFLAAEIYGKVYSK